MASFQLSPGVRVTETDLTAIIPAVATSPAAHAGFAKWGPVMQPIQFSNEDEFVSVFGKPDADTFTSFFNVSNFLAYSKNILFTRAAQTVEFNASNPIADVAGNGASTISCIAGDIDVTGATTPGFLTYAIVGKYLIGPDDEVIGQIASVESDTALTLVEPATVTLTDANYSYGFRTLVNNTEHYESGTVDLDNSGEFIAKYPGAKGNGLVVAIADYGSWVKPGTGTVRATRNLYIKDATKVAGTVTFNTSLAHTLLVGQIVTISYGGVFNGTYAVATIGSKTFTVSQPTGESDISLTTFSGGAKCNSKQLSGVSTSFSTSAKEAVGSYIRNSVTNRVLGRVASVESGVLLTLENYPVVESNSAYEVLWKYYKEFDNNPITSEFAASVNGVYDELHVIVIDGAGEFTGVAGTILEKYPYLSKASNARSSTGATNFYVDYINTNSKYIWFANTPSAISSWGTVANNTTFGNLTYPLYVTLSKGDDGLNPTEGQIMDAFHLYANAELYDVSLIIAGKATYDLANYLIQNIAEVRQDCIVFVSPQNITTDEYIIGSTATETAYLQEYADLIASSSYGVIDSGAKYQYDVYNDKYRWIPLNADIAGLCARTDQTNDPWWSPAGYNRGQIKNVIKLAYNPHERTDRDTLYQARINPVLSEKGQGVLLFGDKTALAKPSAFDRINVRRLFIVLEKSIATAAKYMLFEFNNQATRNLFVGMVLPFLRDVKSRNGIQSYSVVCNEVNNTNEVIASNNFVADIYIQPNYSINFIQLNFIATKNGTATFTEIGL